MAKYSKAKGGVEVYPFDGTPYGYTPVIVLPEADWREMVRYCKQWEVAHRCEGNCQECDEDAAIKAIIQRTEAEND